ncbi:thioesterase II family protein [Flavobacteriaceae bacterium M23B6Z8]
MKNKTKLFCLPYAGGSAHQIYRLWKDYLDESIELHPLELAGRGSRVGDRLYRNLEEAIEDVYKQMKDHILTTDYAFFGHSMGAILGYKVLQKIDELKLPSPVHAFFSGRRAPHCKSRKRKPYAEMTSIELEDELKAMGGTPPAFFEYPELKKVFMPIIKGDLAIADTLLDRSEIKPFNYDISLFLGKDEDVIPEEAKEWKICTEQKFSIQYFPGGHFFLNSQIKGIVGTINRRITKQFYEVKI